MGGKLKSVRGQSGESEDRDAPETVAARPYAYRRCLLASGSRRGAAGPGDHRASGGDFSRSGETVNALSRAKLDGPGSDRTLSLAGRLAALTDSRRPRIMPSPAVHRVFGSLKFYTQASRLAGPGLGGAAGPTESRPGCLYRVRFDRLSDDGHPIKAIQARHESRLWLTELIIYPGLRNRVR